MDGISGEKKQLLIRNILAKYVRKYYQNNAVITYQEFRNYGYDAWVSYGSTFFTVFTVEYKARYFNSPEILDEDDILIELVQSLPYFLDVGLPTNQNINQQCNRAKAIAFLEAAEIPMPSQIREALAELRPHLTTLLRKLPDDKLLALVNWHIMVAWERARQSLEDGR